MSYEFRLPDIGEGLHQAEVLKWFINVGDTIEADQNIIEVQTDKAVVEISTPVGGKVLKLGAEADEVIDVGEVLITLDVGEAVNAESADEKIQFAKNIGDESTSPPSIKDKGKRVIAAPSIRKLAREMGIDISQVTPTGKGGKISEEDLRLYSNNGSNQKVDEDKITHQEDEVLVSLSKEEKREPIRGLRKIIYQNMTKSKSTIPHCTGMDEVNLSKLVDYRSQLIPHVKDKGIKLTYLPFIVKAVAYALKENPIFNSTVDEEKMEIIYRSPINIGIATATENGLIVPVIKHADRKSILEIASEIEDLSIKAREKKIKQSELTGSTFTISNTGRKGGWFATPIINFPEVAILGVHSIQKKPIVVEDQICIANMMGMSVTFDHRIIDGEPCGEFMYYIKKLLENPELLLLEGR